MVLQHLYKATRLALRPFEGVRTLFPLKARPHGGFEVVAGLHGHMVSFFENYNPSPIPLTEYCCPQAAAYIALTCNRKRVVIVVSWAQVEVPPTTKGL